MTVEWISDRQPFAILESLLRLKIIKGITNLINAFFWLSSRYHYRSGNQVFQRASLK